MIDGVRFKVCGVTSFVDAGFADKCGADYLGFNLYPQSPRYLSLRQFSAMAKLLPPRKKVAVAVEPSPSELVEMQSAGFDCFQIHFRPELGEKTIASWAEIVGSERLWLAPKLPAELEVPTAWLDHANTIVLDTFAKDKFGGTGHTGDWGKFARHREKYPQAQWLLAGGLNPENIGDALRASGARFVDVNSGVESAPGVKDETKLRRFAVNLRRARSE
ncbi:MAG: phosphoribosylanthranilate isomerase [Opitutaceae bacterium]|nr:phosphoribosylanthranilate isomerase [Opitutaceae bacterium]